LRSVGLKIRLIRCWKDAREPISINAIRGDRAEGGDAMTTPFPKSQESQSMRTTRLLSRFEGTARSTVAKSASDKSMDRFFKALSDPTRRQILQLLEDGELSVGEVVERFDLSQPTISRHLSVLRQAELVDDRRSGQHVFYRLNGEILATSFADFLRTFETRLPLG
jgi:DNA-binding transcriptional ArsR family regulator